MGVELLLRPAVLPERMTKRIDDRALQALMRLPGFLERPRRFFVRFVVPPNVAEAMAETDDRAQRARQLIDSAENSFDNARAELIDSVIDFDSEHHLMAMHGLHGVSVMLCGKDLLQFLEGSAGNDVSAILPDTEIKAPRCEAQSSLHAAGNGSSDQDRFEGSSALEMIEVDQLHRLEKFGEDAVVAVLDSGIDLAIAAFEERQEKVKCFRHFDRMGHVVGNFRASDSGCHGTKICALIGGKNGVAPKAQLIVLRVLDGSPTLEAGGLIQFLGAMTWLAEAKKPGGDGNDAVAACSVANISIDYHLGPELQFILDDAFQTIESLGIHPICAVGNRGVNNPVSLGSCATYVGAVGPDRKVWEGSGGHGQNGVRIPHVVCPGVGVLCDQPIIETRLASLPQDWYTGTSFAAAFMSGAVSLLESATGRSAKECLDACIKTAQRPDGQKAWCHRYGHGILAAHQAYGELKGTDS